MKLRYPINAHKALTALTVFGMMWFYDNFGTGAFVYLALHGSYGILWIFKDVTYPDRQWERKVSVPYGVFTFIGLSLYWIAPFILISEYREPMPWVIALAVTLSMFGCVLHFGSDAQKYFTLKYKPGLITEGFFSRCRNTNYLGECLLYVGFATLAMSWIGFIGIVSFFLVIFIPNMLRKDKSLSRYPEFNTYKKQSGLFLPKVI